MRLYSKDNIKTALSYMRRENKFSQAFLLTGENGVGKKVAAKYIAKSMMCDSPVDGVPCEKCRNCRKINEGTHVDVIYPERSGAKMIYNRETVRNVCAEAYISPNDCDYKVYIFCDCENIEEATQNLMLKIIEEPPSRCAFVFTAKDRSVFLPTIISRVVSFGISEPSVEECSKVLSEDFGYSASEISEACSAYQGNIGLCLSYLEKEEAYDNAFICKAIVDGIINTNEYVINKIFSEICGDKERLKNILSLTDKVIRDTVILRVNGNDETLIGPYKEGAMLLSQRISYKKAVNLHEYIIEAEKICNTNANMQIMVASLCGELSG